MRQFFAILKDSFREAVDGFVIYLMLALSVLLVVVVASISFAPAPPDEALPKVMQNFRMIFPDRGKSAAPTGVPVEYKTADAEATPNGAKFVLTAASPKAPKSATADAEKDGAPADGFRYAVYAWREPAGEKNKNPFGNRPGGRNRNQNQRTDLEFVLPPPATAADLQTVTDADMAAFIKDQFATFAGVGDVTVTRRPGVAEPEYQFDVGLRDISGARGWPHAISLFFGSVPPIKGVPLGQALQFIEDVIVNGIGAAVTLMLSVVITAFFIPNLLRKGSVDLLISKPIGRSQLLVYKYVGGLTFIFLLSAVSIGGVWLALAVRSGQWDPSFLLVIPVLTFTFAILYAVSTVVAVFTRSAIAAILVSLGFMLFLYILGQVKSFFDMNKVTNIMEAPDWVYTVVDTANNLLPRYKDLDKLTSKLVVDSTLTPGEVRLGGLLTDYPSWSGAIGVSVGFIAIMLALSCWRFSRRDY
ncbi:MAG: transporter permease [Gemmataceae bacterium]|nr:transporter permease [Gemmataceae bacterium]